MLHLVCGTNCSLISASLVRHSLLYIHLSHVAVHHLYHLHYHHLHLLLLVQSFILNLRLGSSANPFLHRPFFSYQTDSTNSGTIYCFYFAQRLDLFAWCVKTKLSLSHFLNALTIIALSYHYWRFL